MKTTSRTWSASKASWAAAKAAAARAAIESLPQRPAGDWRGVRARMQAVDRLRQEALRFERMAARLAGGAEP